MKIGGDSLRRDISETDRLVWLLIVGELVTPRGQPGPLARPWAARSRSQPRSQLRRPGEIGRSGERE